MRAWGSSLLTSAIVVDAKAHGDRLIDTGPFALLRHPLYAGAGLMMLALALYLPPALSVPLLVFDGIIGIRLATFEESLLAVRFGEAFARYRERTGLFMPKRLPIHREDWQRLRHTGKWRAALISECTFLFYGISLALATATRTPRVLFIGVLASSVLGALIVKRFATQVRLGL